MFSTGIVTDDVFLAHDTGPGHPERPDRLIAVSRALGTCGRSDLVSVASRPATDEELALVHDPGHIRRVAATAGRDSYAFDADTPVSARSHEAALRAAGGTLELVDAVVEGRVTNGFAFVRPPGHHAESGRAMGFCLFNNVALAAARLRQQHGLGRVLVVDWDVHHGNGTQHSFYDDGNVLFLSSHQYPFYPGSGGLREVGVGDGEGATLNLPFPGGYGDPEYVEAYLEVVEPVMRSFEPEFVLVSAGFDAHRRDPLASMNVSDDGFRALARIILRVAHDVCADRVVAVLEGGYDLIGLAGSVSAVLDEMSGTKLAEPVTPPAGTRPDLEEPRAIARHYWHI